MGADCPEALAKLQLYLDGELSDDQVSEISVHLEACYPCGDRADFERHLRVVIRQCADETAPAGLFDRLRAQFELEA